MYLNSCSEKFDNKWYSSNNALNLEFPPFLNNFISAGVNLSTSNDFTVLISFGSDL